MTDEAPVVADSPPADTNPPGASSGGDSQEAPATAALAASPEAAVASDGADTATAMADAAADKVSPTSLLGDTSEGGPATDANDQSPVVEEAPGATPQAIEYAEFVFPEGITVKDPEIFREVTGVLGEHGVPQEKAQALLDKHIAVVSQATADAVEQYRAQAETERKQNFARDINERLAQAEQTFGGADSERFKTTVQTAVSVLDNYGKEWAPQFRKVMNDAGLGTHPAVVGLLYNLGVALGEGSAVPAAKPVAQAPVSRAGRRYVS